MPNPKKPSKGASHRNLRDKHAECNLKFISLNARRLTGKIPEFHALIDEHRPDIVCVTETHLDSTIPTYEIFPDYFNVYRKDRNLDGDVVAIAVKNLASLPCLNLDSEAEIVWSQILLTTGKTFLMGCYYHVPDSPIGLWKDLDASLDQIPQEASSVPHIVLTSDFNAKTINWGDGVQTANSSHRNLVDITNKHFLSQHVLEPTRITETTATILYLLFSSIPSSIQNVEVMPSISDHKTVLCTIKTNPKQMTKPRRKIYCYGKADFDSIRTDMDKFKNNFYANDPQTRTVNHNWTKLKDRLHNAKESFIPSKLSSTRSNLPWINTRIKCLIRATCLRQGQGASPCQPI